MKRALLIGNTDGIGRVVTDRLLAAGWTVEGVSRSDLDLAHDAYRHSVLDVRDRNFRAKLDYRVAANPPDLCIYFAGVGHGFDLEHLSGDRHVLEVNLMGFMSTVEVVLPAMIRAGRGHLIGLSSIADVVSGADGFSYFASKAGMSRYLAGLALALRSRKSPVKVTNIRFGFVDTKMADAPVKPMMITAEQAADRVLRCVRRRPAVYTYPRTMGWLAKLAGMIAGARLRLIRG